MQCETKKHSKLKQHTHSKKDEKLLSLQKHFTQKIADTTDEQQIRFYLQEVSKIAQQRLTLMKGGAL